MYSKYYIIYVAILHAMKRTYYIYIYIYIYYMLSYLVVYRIINCTKSIVVVLEFRS